MNLCHGLFTQPGWMGRWGLLDHDQKADREKSKSDISIQTIGYAKLQMTF